MPVLPVNWHLLDGGVCRVGPQTILHPHYCPYRESCILTADDYLKVNLFTPLQHSSLFGRLVRIWARPAWALELYSKPCIDPFRSRL